MTAARLGIITPHPPAFVPTVGRGLEGADRSLAALSRARGALDSFAPETLIVMSPHAPGYADAVSVDGSARLAGSLAQFGDSEVRRWTGDPELAGALLGELESAEFPAVDRTHDARLTPGVLDHGVLVPLEFLDPERRYRLVVVSLSMLPHALHRAIGEAAARAAESLGRRVCFVASGDLSHGLAAGTSTGFRPRGAELDRAIVELVTEGRLRALGEIDPELVEAGAECGLRSIIAVGGFCGEDPVPTQVLSYEGPWGVGYLTALVGECAATAESEIVKLARAAIDAHVHGRPLPESPALHGDEYPQRAGAFVSLHLNGQLRGCIGTVAPTAPTLAEEVVRNAVAAASRDPRFEPVTPGELDSLEVKVDVLHPPESCDLSDLDPRKYGVIVRSGWRQGLLLPDLEGVDDVGTQVAIARSKGGIQPGEPCDFERFRVDRYT